MLRSEHCIINTRHDDDDDDDLWFYSFHKWLFDALTYIHFSSHRAVLSENAPYHLHLSSSLIFCLHFSLLKKYFAIIKIRSSEFASSKNKRIWHSDKKLLINTTSPYVTLQEEAKNLKIDEKFMKVLVLFLYMLSQQLAKKSMATMSLSLFPFLFVMCWNYISPRCSLPSHMYKILSFTRREGRKHSSWW